MDQQEGVEKPKRPKTDTRRESHVVDRLGPRDNREAVVRNIIGPKIKQRRLALGWTQAQLGGRITQLSGGKWEVKDEDVRRFETQRKLITDREIPMIAEALQCSAAWLLGEHGAPEPLPIDIKGGQGDQTSSDAE